MKNFTKDWFSHNIPVLESSLKEFKNKSGVYALEIGSFEGRSTCWFMDNILTGFDSGIDCVDTFEGSPEFEKLGVSATNIYKLFLENTKVYGDRVTSFKQKSVEFFKEIVGVKPAYDFAYIDGSHKAEDVYLDAVGAFMLVKTGGILAFDDYGWDIDLPESDKPKLGIDKFLGEYHLELEVIHRGYLLVAKKI